MKYCDGTGIEPDPNDVWRAAGFENQYNREGYRTICPVCSKVSAVTPTGRVIQKHYPPSRVYYDNPETWEENNTPSTLNERLDILYEEVYNLGHEGLGDFKPERGLRKKEREVWIMAYLDGLGDGGHDTALKRFEDWLVFHR